MMYVLYDNTFEGLLTAVFEVYEQKLLTIQIRKEGTELPSLFDEPLLITYDETKTKRVLMKLNALLKEEGVIKLWKAWLTEETDVEDCILGTIRYAIEQQDNILSDFGNWYVLQLNQQLKKIAREKHRMEAFVRFQLTKDELYYAVIEPDFNVLPLLIHHFQSRYADQRWLIFDKRRNYGIYYNLQTTEFITFDEWNIQPGVLNKDLFHEEETIYQILWRDYFKSATITSRKNNKLHLQHMPKRYWKYLTEKGSNS